MYVAQYEYTTSEKSFSNIPTNICESVQVSPTAEQRKNAHSLGKPTDGLRLQKYALFLNQRKKVFQGLVISPKNSFKSVLSLAQFNQKSNKS